MYSLALILCLFVVSDAWVKQIGYRRLPLQLKTVQAFTRGTIRLEPGRRITKKKQVELQESRIEFVRGADLQKYCPRIEASKYFLNSFQKRLRNIIYKFYVTVALSVQRKEEPQIMSGLI